MQDVSTDFDHDDLAVAMARSLEDYPEEDQKGKKVVGKSHGYRVWQWTSMPIMLLETANCSYQTRYNIAGA